MWKTLRNRLVVSFIVLLVGVGAYTGNLDKAVSRILGMRQLDERAEEYFNESIKRAVYTFAIARAANGIISVVQDSEFNISPAGLGITVAIGELLDPVNDLVERFSWIMLASTASLGVQKILMEIGSWIGFNLLISFSMICILLGIWLQRFTRLNFMSVGKRFLIAAVVVRLCIPLTAVATSHIYDVFLDKKFVEATESLDEVNREIKDSEILADSGEDLTSDSGFFGSMTEKYQQVKEAIDFKNKVLFLKDKITNYAKYFINLIVIFVLQTIVIPILILWGLIKLFVYLTGRDISQPLEQKFRELVSKKELAHEAEKGE